MSAVFKNLRRNQAILEYERGQKEEKISPSPTFFTPNLLSLVHCVKGCPERYLI
jgi:hypothetical protein